MPVDIMLPFGWNEYYDYNQHIIAIKQNLAAGLKLFYPSLKIIAHKMYLIITLKVQKIHVRMLTLPI